MAPRSLGVLAANFTYIPVNTTAQTPMLAVHPTVNPEVQGSNLVMDIFSFITNFYSQIAPWCDGMQHALVHIRECQRHDFMEHASTAHRTGTHST